MSKVYAATSLTGGVTGSLDNINGSALNDKDVAMVTVQGGNMMPFVLDASSGASENSPYVISPDDNAGTKRWVMTGVQGAFSHVRATSNDGQTRATGTTFIYEDEEYDDLGEYVHTTGIFTATYAGLYVISSSNLFSASWTASKILDATIIASTAPATTGRRWTAQLTTTINVPASVSTTLKLAASETIHIEIDHDNGGSVTSLGGADFNWLTIDRIA